MHLPSTVEVDDHQLYPDLAIIQGFRGAKGLQAGAGQFGAQERKKLRPALG